MRSECYFIQSTIGYNIIGFDREYILSAVDFNVEKNNNVFKISPY